MRIRELEQPINSMRQDSIDKWLNAKKDSEDELIWIGILSYNLFWIEKSKREKKNAKD